MRNSDEVVARVLRGLGEVEAPAGMEGRVLRALAARGPVAARLWWRGSGARLAMGALLSGGLAVGVLLVMPRSLPVARVVGPLVPVVVVRSTTASAGSVAVGRGRPKRRRARVAALEAEDSVAVSEMLAPRLVAPPLPLTEQERLLLRVVRRQREEVAVLGFGMRSQQEQEAKVEFVEFFEQVSKQAFSEQVMTKENR